MFLTLSSILSNQQSLIFTSTVFTSNINTISSTLDNIHKEIVWRTTNRITHIVSSMNLLLRVFVSTLVDEFLQLYHLILSLLIVNFPKIPISLLPSISPNSPYWPNSIILLFYLINSNKILFILIIN